MSVKRRAENWKTSHLNQRGRHRQIQNTNTGLTSITMGQNNTTQLTGKRQQTTWIQRLHKHMGKVKG